MTLNIKKYVNHLDTDERQWACILIQEDLMKFEQTDYIQNVLEKGYVGWNNPTFSHLKHTQEEYDKYTKMPFDLSEGVLQCKKCKCKKIFSYQTQIRSADEPMTTICKCSECGATWSENN